MSTVSQRVDEQESTLHYDGTVHLDFDPVAHKYFINGEIANGVTTALGIISKPYLIPWAARMAGDYIKSEVVPGESLDELQIQELVDGAKNAHRKNRDGAADAGTYIHNWIEEFVATGKKPEMPIAPKLASVINSFLRWWESTNIEVIKPEIKLCSPTLMLAGTADLLCRVDGKLTVMDWKTGSGIYADMFLQLAAYALMYEEEFDEKVEQVYIVNASIKNMFQTDVRDNMDFFKKTYLQALDLYKSNKELEKLIKGGKK